MNNNLIARVEITLKAPISKVWQALTDPSMIKQYLFGTEVVTDWKVGSSIVWKGVWQGKEYQDKGQILQLVPEKLLETTCWSSMSGLPDKLENYKKVKYELEEDNGTKLILIQDNNLSEEEKNHSEENWRTVLDGLKKLVDK